MGSNHILRPSEGGTVTRAAPCRAPSEDVSGVQEHMSKARGAFVHGPPGGTVADLRLRPACRLNLGRFDRRRAMTAICASPSPMVSAANVRFPANAAQVR